MTIIGQRHRRARVGSCTVDFWWNGDGIEVHWDPEPPRRWKASQLAKYRVERNAFVAELAKTLGGSVIIVEV